MENPFWGKLAKVPMGDSIIPSADNSIGSFVQRLRGAPAPVSFADFVISDRMAAAFFPRRLVFLLEHLDWGPMIWRRVSPLAVCEYDDKWNYRLHDSVKN
ncbi:hypothetical protein TNCT_64681 [Trichonephila clavata]|uniref:Uncharacterized protein n=1 Tax=Trichonephila clavata TaxID=2740835 RepID=A0A8X6HQG5_TRICU|nr:hypothetical protein TNCT_64681 [Trichonephila clavata]